MLTRRFGGTGVQVSELVFGGGWVGGILIHQDDDTKRAAIRMAVDAGINWIDTAGDYGQGQSEQALGWLLAELPAAERPHVSTKVRLDLQSNESAESQIRRGIEQSLERLRMDKVVLFQLHNPVVPETTGQLIGVDPVLRPGGVADVLEALKQEGLCDHIGFTALGDAPSCIRVVESGRFESAQVYYNMLNPTAGLDAPGGLRVQDMCGLIAACRRADVAVMNIRVFAGGTLASPVRHGREVPITTETDLDVEARRADAALAAIGEDQGTRSQRALRFSLSNPDVSCVVIGLAELAHLEEAIGAAERGPLPDAALARLQQLWDRNFDL